jgi:hypothetical protein
MAALIPLLIGITAALGLVTLGLGVFVICPRADVPRNGRTR